MLTTDRLRLRPLAPADAGALYELDRDPEVMRHIGPPREAEVAGYVAWIEALWRDEYGPRTGLGFWAVEDRQAGDFLGWFHLRRALDWRYADLAGYRAGDLDVGYRLRRAAWGRGYATEMTRALVRHGLAVRRAPRIVAATLAANTASRRVLEKSGLRQVGTAAIPEHDEGALIYATADEGCTA